MIPLDDRGFTVGDGLFETVLAEKGVLRRAPAHAARMAAGCEVLRLPAPSLAEFETAAQAALAEAGLGQARAAVRLTLTAGSGGRGLDRPAAPAPRLVATAAASPKPSTPATLAVASVRRNSGSPASRLKTLSYLDNVLARAEASASGADEALMLNGEGLVACAAAANLFWFQDGVLHTPALDCGVLAGVTRAAIIEAAPGLGLAVREVRADLAALQAGEAIFLSNSLIGLRPVAALDGRPYPAWGGLDALAAMLNADPAT